MDRGIWGSNRIRTSPCARKAAQCGVKSSAASSPGDFGGAGIPIGDTRQHEEKIGEPVQIDDYYLRHVFIAAQTDDRAFGPSADCSCDVQGCRFWRPAWKNERAQRLQSALAVVDCPLQFGDPCFGDLGLFQVLRHLLPVWRGQQRSNREEVTLYWNKQLVHPGQGTGGTNDPDRCVELIHVAVGGDARMVLRHAATAKESGVAAVSGTGIDLHVRRESTAAPAASPLADYS